MDQACRILDPTDPKPLQDRQLAINRRQFFSRGATGIGAAALAGLLGRDGLLAGPSSRHGGVLGASHLPAKAKRVIYLFQNGAPTHVDLFDYKPRLHKLHGTPVPEEYLGSKRFSTMTGNPKGKLMLEPVEPFQQHGHSGAWVSKFMPHTAKVVDDLCFIKSMHTEAVNHAPAISFLLSGSEMPGRPTMGAWLNYGLGASSEELPGFVVMRSGGNLSGGSAMWGSGFLPSEHQGVPFREGSDPILHVTNPKGIDRTAQRQTLDLLNKLNRRTHQRMGDPEITARIEA